MQIQKPFQPVIDTIMSIIYNATPTADVRS